MGFIAAAWGFAGLLFILIGPIIRLGELSLEAMEYEVQWYHWAVGLANIGFMLFTEGYRGFQKKFSPRVGARLKHLYENPRWLDVFLAPLYIMGFYHTTRRRQIATFALLFVIIIFVILIRMLPQPWRGMLDMGVVLGLSYGTVTILYFVWQAFTNKNYSISPELPDS